MGQGRSIFKVFLNKLIGFLVFLVLLGIAYILIDFIPNQIYEDIVIFLFSNLFLILLITIAATISEMFWVLDFPLNLPAPLFSGTMAVLMAEFFYNLSIFIGTLMDKNLLPIDKTTQLSIYLLLFAIVLIIGYIKILFYFFKPKKTYTEEKSKKSEEKNNELADVKKSIAEIKQAMTAKKKKTKSKPKKAVKKKKVSKKK